MAWVAAALMAGNAAAQAIQLVPGEPIPIGSAQSQIAIVDLNRDGILDLVVGSSSIVTRIGLGNGRFTAGTTIPSNGHFFLADFNRDGNPDLVAGGRLYLGNGDGTFRTGPALSADVAADIDGDGCTDGIGIANGDLFTRPPSISVYRGNCDSAFRPYIVTDVGVDGENFVTGVAAGDFDRDGRDDLAIAFTHAVVVYPGQADGHVGAARATGIILIGIADVGLGGGKLLVTDVDHDGKIDLVAAESEFFPAGFMRIALGNGDGTFRAASVPTWTGWGARGFAAADLDGNGFTDFALVGCLASPGCEPNNDRFYVFPGEGGGYGAPSTFATGSKPTDVAIGDLDGDGRPDVVVTTNGTDVLVFLNASIAVSPAGVPALGPTALALLLLALLTAGAFVLRQYPRPR